MKRTFVNYEEWLTNVNNENWSGWKDVKFIESTVGRSRNCPDWFSHAICFLNNYLLEKHVKEFLKLDYLGDDHECWFQGKGYPLPDFKDQFGITYELKQMKDRESLKMIPDVDWHDADIRLAYFRIEAWLYISSDKGKTWTKLRWMKPIRIHYKELATYETLCTKERTLCTDDERHAAHNGSGQ